MDRERQKALGRGHKIGEALAACQLIWRSFQQCKCDFDELSLGNVERDIRNTFVMKNECKSV